MRTLKLFFYFFLLFLLVSFPVQAAEESNSFVTIIYPIRNRNLWVDTRLEVLSKQIELAESRHLPVTYLVQYDALYDKEITDRLKNTATLHEIGLFLEVSKNLATDSFVPYIIGSGDWARPDKVFFSGYTLAERKRMVGRLMREFKIVFGYFPQSVGAWYIDAPTLVYLREKYKVEASLTVADQYSTDKYHVWGKYYGVPYYPSKYNTLMPAQSLGTKLDIVTTQWAQRDVVKAYGPDVSASTYSLQANDYHGHHRLDTDYFKDVFYQYSEPHDNLFSQVTVGIEVGQETPFLPELSNQLELIKSLKDKKVLSVLTMSDFAQWYKSTFPGISPPHGIGSYQYEANKPFSFWYMTPSYRINFFSDNKKLVVRDFRVYDDIFIEDDYLFPDKRTTLFRTVSGDIDDLVYKNALTIASEVSDIKVKPIDNGMELRVKDNNGEKTIKLLEKDIYGIEGITVPKNQKVPLNQGLNWAVETLAFFNSNDFFINLPEIRYSNIAGSQIYGLSVDHKSILGFKTSPPSFGFFSFPFQTMAFFKTLPSIVNEAWIPSSSTLEANSVHRLRPLTEIVPRDQSDLQDIKTRETLGQKRIFENSNFTLWDRFYGH